MSCELYASFMKILLCVFFGLRIGCGVWGLFVFFLVVDDLFLISFVFLLRFCPSMGLMRNS